MVKILVVLVGVIFIAQLVRVLELANLLSKTKNEVTDSSNNFNGYLLLISGFALLIFFFWQRAEWMHLTLRNPSSEHGLAIEALWDTTMGLIIIVFLVLTPMLFGFAFLYRGNATRKASYITHNNKLEVFWTAIPAVILFVLIAYGLKVWGDIVNQDTSDAIVIEVYAKQFGWSARYSGDDNQLGRADVRYVGGMNELGVISANTKDTQIDEINQKIKKLEDEISTIPSAGQKKLISERVEKLLKKKKVLTTYFLTTKEDQLLAAEDDIVVKELHLPVNKKVLLKFRSQDVIHSAYLPHFMVQMNCVPGTTTQFAFTPTVTSKDIKKEKGDDFEYILLCNKICGNAHYNMQMKVVVETEDEYNKWLAEQSDKKIINL